MSDKDIHQCSRCGYQWIHGQHGGHSCTDRLLERINKLQQIINEQNKILVCNELIPIDSAINNK